MSKVDTKLETIEVTEDEAASLMCHFLGNGPAETCFGHKSRRKLVHKICWENRDNWVVSYV